jgi:heme exporter protein B
MMAAFAAVLRRDLRLALRRPVDTAQGLLFFVLALALFPLGVGPGPETLARIGPGVVWVLALLAVMLTLDRLFQGDAEDGSLDLMALAPAPLEATALAKCLAHWLTSGLALALCSPLLGLMMGIEGRGLAVLPLALLLGTPTLTLIGGVGAALTLGSRRAGLLLALLVLPLYVPVLVFGVGAVEGALTGAGSRPQLLILAAMLLASLALAPFAIAAALRLALE